MRSNTDSRPMFGDQQTRDNRVEGNDSSFSDSFSMSIGNPDDSFVSEQSAEHGGAPSMPSTPGIKRSGALASFHMDRGLAGFSANEGTNTQSSNHKSFRSLAALAQDSPEKRDETPLPTAQQQSLPPSTSLRSVKTPHTIRDYPILSTRQGGGVNTPIRGDRYAIPGLVGQTPGRVSSYGSAHSSASKTDRKEGKEDRAEEVASLPTVVISPFEKRYDFSPDHVGPKVETNASVARGVSEEVEAASVPLPTADEAEEALLAPRHALVDERERQCSTPAVTRSPLKTTPVNDYQQPVEVVASPVKVFSGPVGPSVEVSAPSTLFEKHALHRDEPTKPASPVKMASPVKEPPVKPSPEKIYSAPEPEVALSLPSPAKASRIQRSPVKSSPIRASPIKPHVADSHLSPEKFAEDNSISIASLAPPQPRIISNSFRIPIADETSLIGNCRPPQSSADTTDDSFDLDIHDLRPMTARKARLDLDTADQFRRAGSASPTKPISRAGLLAAPSSGLDQSTLLPHSPARSAHLLTSTHALSRVPPPWEQDGMETLLDESFGKPSRPIQPSRSKRTFPASSSGQSLASVGEEAEPGAKEYMASPLDISTLLPSSPAKMQHLLRPEAMLQNESFALASDGPSFMAGPPSAQSTCASAKAHQGDTTLDIQDLMAKIGKPKRESGTEESFEDLLNGRAELDPMEA